MARKTPLKDILLWWHPKSDARSHSAFGCDLAYLVNLVWDWRAVPGSHVWVVGPWQFANRGGLDSRI